MLKLYMHPKAFEEYDEAQKQDKKKIKEFIKCLTRNSPLTQVPEPLTGNFSGWFSLAVNKKNRFVYKTYDDVLEVYQCTDHYDDH